MLGSSNIDIVNKNEVDSGGHHSKIDIVNRFEANTAGGHSNMWLNRVK